MPEEKPLVDKQYLLQKYPGKGGWTYAAIPEILQNKNAPFGWVTVKGSIDGYALKQYKLMPMGNGQLFLPVKAAIRKKNRQRGRRLRAHHPLPRWFAIGYSGRNFALFQK